MKADQFPPRLFALLYDGYLFPGNRIACQEVLLYVTMLQTADQADWSPAKRLGARDSSPRSWSKTCWCAARPGARPASSTRRLGARCFPCGRRKRAAHRPAARPLGERSSASSPRSSREAKRPREGCRRCGASPPSWWVSWMTAGTLLSRWRFFVMRRPEPGVPPGNSGDGSRWSAHRFVSLTSEIKSCWLRYCKLVSID